MLILAVVALEVPLALSLRDRVDAEVRSEATAQTGLVAATAADLLTPLRPRTLQRLVASTAGSVRGRAIVVDTAGSVVADSSVPPRLGQNYGSRPEVAAALRGERTQRTRRSSVLDAELLATAQPIMFGGQVVGAVRITQSVADVRAAVQRTTIELVAIGGVVLFLGLLVGALVAGWIARPLRRLESASRRVADGDLAARAPVEGSAEQRALATSFNDMTSRVGRLLDAQRDFVADASHQLRTPLTGLRLRIGEARAAESRAAADLELDAAEREIHRLSSIVDELLVLSRAGERDAPAEVCRLDVAARRAVARWAPAASEHNVAVDVSLGFERSEVEVLCAPGDLDRAIDVLVENALFYADAGGELTIAVFPDRLEVWDRGPGIDADESESVFERFRRGEAGRTGPAGTGLGLPIARELAREWGGEATLRPRVGGGTVARLHFPVSAGVPS